jgi:hypothetical protein
MYRTRSVMAAVSATCALLAPASIAAAQSAIQWRTEDGGNGHWYAFRSQAEIVCWSTARGSAEAEGGHLVTLTSVQENDWVRESLVVPNSMGCEVSGPFTGGTCEGRPWGQWYWITGEPFTYSAFANGEPNSGGNEQYIHYWSWCAGLHWNDTVACGSKSWITEWSADCNNDGIVDYGQIQSGQLADANGNNIPDICDCDSDSDGDGASDCTDGCPLEAALQQPVIYYLDVDRDGYGTYWTIAACTTVPPEWTATVAGDCDDGNAAAYPGAIELCDGADNDCDGETDEAPDGFLGYYWDADCDGAPRPGLFDTCNPWWGGCWIPASKWVPPVFDCNDSDPTVQPPPAMYFVDADHDGFGSGPGIESCTPIDGRATNNIDCDDTQISYTDADADGFGAGLPAPCGVSNSIDCDDSNSAVFPGAADLCNGQDDDCDGVVDEEPQYPLYLDVDGDGFAGDTVYYLTCDYVPPPWIFDCDDQDASIYPGAIEFCNGIDNDCNGLVDDTCGAVTLVMTPDASALAPGASFVVRVSAVAPHPIVELVGLQAAMHFDAARLELVDVAPAPAGPLDLEIAQLVDNDGGTVRYALGTLPRETGVVGSAPLFDLLFRVRDDAELCATALELVRFEPVSDTQTVFVAIDGASVAPALVSLPPIDGDGAAPVLTGVPAPIVVPADAGSLVGAAVEQPLVTAVDACGPADLTLAIAFAGGGSASEWPADDHFPIGTSTVSWTAVDLAGNTRTESTTILVEPFQLLDVTVAMAGAFDPNRPSFTRLLRVTVGAQPPQTMPFLFDPANATASVTSITVPLSDAAPCVVVKDLAFSITAAAEMSMSGGRYQATATLKQGDSNNDDSVDILDFGLWYIDLGPAGSGARSDFNADGFVTSADFAWIALHFFLVGESCVDGYAGQVPVQRIAVKELRRRGLGELAAADVNADGWLDARDVRRALDMASAGASDESAPPDAR